MKVSDDKYINVFEISLIMSNNVVQTFEPWYSMYPKKCPEFNEQIMNLVLLSGVCSFV